MLADRILAARLTILYGYSGLGKSSLIRTLVIPRLEESGSLVIYFDAWSQEEPFQALKETLIHAAAGLGIPDPGSGSPNLTELMRLLNSIEDAGVVLVLDQFEEFLTRHSQRLDPLRKEIAAVVRAPGLDATVVLSLREEFLAALEPFRQEILNLYQSTYRLEHLSTEHLIDAIRRPAEVFHGSCEPQLADELIADLRAKEAEDAAAGGMGTLELPMLQLVCSELWKQAEAEHHRNLTLDVYNRLERTNGILSRYLRAVMPKAWGDQEFTARLMTLLAPPSGLKMSYSAEDLASTTGLDRGRIQRELERLSASRIVRTRTYRSGERFELMHDALATVVRRWCELALRTARWCAWAKRAVEAALLIIVIAWIGIRVRSELQSAAEAEKESTGKAKLERAMRQAEKQGKEKWEHGGLLEELRKAKEKKEALAASRFEYLTSHALWEDDGADRFDRLRDTLIRHQDLLPDGYGERGPGQAHVELATRYTPLTIQYSRERKIEPLRFAMEWREYAGRVAEKWGIPVPGTVQLIPAPRWARERIRISGKGVAPLEFELKADEDRDLLIFPQTTGLEKNDLYQVVLQFHQRFKKDWEPFRARKDLETWWIVPRWSAPVWKVGIGAAQRNYLLTSGSGLAAFRCIQYLLKHPEPLLSPVAVKFLLQRKIMRDLYEETVREAQRARGSRLPLDLAAIVRKDRSLSSLPQILDALAEAGDQEESAGIAARFDEAEWMDPSNRIPTRLHGPWARLGMRDESTEEEISAYRMTESDLSPVQRPIRAYVGANLMSKWFKEDSISGPLSNVLEELRHDFHREYGVSLPGVQFYDGAGPDGVGANAVRLEMQNDRAGPEVRPVTLKPDNSIAEFIHILRRKADDRRIFWVTAETVRQLLGAEDSLTGAGRSRVAPNTRAWLNEKYSLTDLKVLMRDVVALGGRESTVRYGNWLLTSLVFWSKAGDHLDTAQMARFLRATQSARITIDKSRTPGRVAAGIYRGAQALAQDRVAEAEKEFDAAVKEDRVAAVGAFIAIWPTLLPRVWLGNAAFVSLNALASTPKLSGTERLDLEDMPVALDPWYLSVCRLAAGLIKESSEQVATENRLLADRPPGGESVLEPAAWLAARFLNRYDPVKDDPRLFAEAKQVVKDALVRLDDANAYAVFTAVLRTAETRPPAWIWPLLNELANSRPDDLRRSARLDLALVLCEEERQERLAESLAGAEQIEKLLPSAGLAQARREYVSELISYIRAFAFHGLARQGDKPRLIEAERLLRVLLTSTAPTVRRRSHIHLIQLLQDTGRYDEADTLSATARHRWPDDWTFLTLDLLRDVRRGRAGAVAAAAQRAAERATAERAVGNREQALFLGALGGILTRSPWAEKVGVRFLESEHDNRDYVRLMLYAHQATHAPSEARARLEARWQQIDPYTWPARLRNGDSSAWREMLVGRVLGRVSESDLFGKIEDEGAWKQSDLFHLPVPRRGLLCEAWFYEAMRAKAEGQAERMRDCLRRCLAVGYTSYYEHAMAMFLLAQQTE
jgi:hypothetical protein